MLPGIATKRWQYCGFYLKLASRVSIFICLYFSRPFVALATVVVANGTEVIHSVQ